MDAVGAILKVRVDGSGSHAICPYCDESKRIVHGKISRHGFRCHGMTSTPQNEIGGEKGSPCGGSGMSVTEPYTMTLEIRRARHAYYLWRKTNKRR